MTQEDKELLLKDLCTRLPYGVKVFYSETVPISTLKTINAEKEDCIVYDHTQWYRHTKFHIETIKPYLRPMSSMTEEEEKELAALYVESMNVENISSTCMCAQFYYKHHIDGMGLISKGLALEAPEDMYKEE